MAAASSDSCGSSKKVTDVRNPESKKSIYSQNHGTSSRSHFTGRGGLSSQFKYDPLRSSQSNDKLAGSSHIDQSAAAFNNPHGSNAQSTARKNQMMNANHLLNFYYDPISRPQPRMPPPKRTQKIKPYNKDLFLQANFKFVVLGMGNSAIESMDPDKMLQWEDVICVKYSTPFPVQCPICLESPLCPQITSCGHIFCFPCILRYLLMGEEDHKGDCWKKCPLCFMMVSSKDLYTIYIDYVNQYRVGDHVDFVLLRRPKDSLVPSQKNNQETSSVQFGTDGLCDSFSKFTVTSDVELSVRAAKMDLNDWLGKAEHGLVEDMEQLPYVSAALEHLEQRKKCWDEHQVSSSSPPPRNTSTPCSNLKDWKHTSNKTEVHETTNADAPNYETSEPTCRTSCIISKDESFVLDNIFSEKLGGEDCLVPHAYTTDSFDCLEKDSCSFEEDKGFFRHPSGLKDVKERDTYTFYQAIDGQHLILHPLNMKCLLHHYGSYNLLPSRIGGEILQMETVTQSEAMRRRYRFLSHFSLTTTFQLCEIDLSGLLPAESLSPFIDEIKRREKQRKRVAKKENEEKAKADAAAAAAALQATPILPYFRHSSYNKATFSIDDFEALGSSSVTSMSPPVVGERKLFSDVTRLGFAAAHDSPSLKADESVDSSSDMEVIGEASSLTGPRTAPMLSFANIISTAKSDGGLEVPKMNGFGKKGKKASKVLLSTAGGRRY